jgi:23S rRNA (uridine2552-2'-O)-methyltransferase
VSSKLTVSSRRWLARQARDPYVARSRHAGYRSRAAYKLAEIDDRFKLLRPGRRVLDLGAAPGGWAQVAAERTQSTSERPRVFAVDLQEMENVTGVRLAQLDLQADDAIDRLLALTSGPVDIVLSDMAPAMSGHREIDQLRSVGLAEAALEVAGAMLKPGGDFVVKLRQGVGEVDFVGELKKRFMQVRRVKPPASRSESAEFFAVATGFKG